MGNRILFCFYFSFVHVLVFMLCYWLFNLKSLIKNSVTCILCLVIFPNTAAKGFILLFYWQTVYFLRCTV